MSQRLDTLTGSLLQAARKAGADSADAMAVRGTAVSVDVRAGALEQAEREESTDIGLRVFVGQRVAVVSASNTSAATVLEMAERAVAMAREAPEDAFAGLADPDQLSTSWDLDALELFDPAPEPDPAVLQEDAARAEAAGLAVKGVSQVQSASAVYDERSVHLEASNGFSGGYRRTGRALSCVAIAGTGTGMERDYDGDSRIFQNGCVGCHAGMDGLAGAFAYYEWDYPANGDKSTGSLGYTPGSVSEKHNINATSFEYGYETINDSWINYWRNGPNSTLANRSGGSGWGANPNPDSKGNATGNGAKELGMELANSKAFAQCQVDKAFKAICLRDPNVFQVDREARDGIVSNFTGSGYDMRGVFTDVAAHCKGFEL